jgi:hypothetical protein
MNRRLGTVVVALMVGAAVIVPLAEVLRPLLEAGAVLVIAFVGLRMIATAPFRRL